MPSYSTILSNSLVDVGVAGNVKSYATPQDLPIIGLQNGDMSFVVSNSKLYIWSNGGWFSVALVNLNPSFTVSPNSNYNFATNGTPIVLNLAASDPEGFPLTWNYSVTAGSLTNGGGVTATVTNDGNGQFTITPSTNESYVGTFSLTFTASDGVNIATASTTFTLQFQFWQNAGTLGSNSATLIGTLAAVSSNPRGILVNEDLQLVYYFDYQTDTIHQRQFLNNNLSSWATESTKAISGKQHAYLMAFTFDKTGSNFYLADTGGSGNANTIKQYVCSTPWDVTTMSSSPIATFTYSLSGYIYGMSISDDGTSMWVSHETTGYKKLTLSTPYNLGTASVSSTTYGSGLNRTTFWIHPSLNRAFAVQYATGVVYEYSFNTPGDPTSGINQAYSFTIGSTQGIICISVGTNGQYLYIMGQSGTRSLYKYQLN